MPRACALIQIPGSTFRYVAQPKDDTLLLVQIRELVLLIDSVWLVSLGRCVVKRGYRRLIDHGAWRYSLFQLGVGWIERLQSFHR